MTFMVLFIIGWSSMSKKKLLIIVGALLFIVLAVIIIYVSTKKIYLSDEYYEEKESYDIYEEITGEDLEQFKDKTFVLYVSGSHPHSLEIGEMIEHLEEKYTTQFLIISFGEFKGTSYYPSIKYSSSILIIQNGEVIDSLDLSDENNYEFIEDEKMLEKWLKKRIHLVKK